jgi:hypothetical protein
MTHMYTKGTLTWPEERDVNFSDTGIVGSDSFSAWIKVWYISVYVRDV